MMKIIRNTRFRENKKMVRDLIPTGDHVQRLKAFIGAKNGKKASKHSALLWFRQN